MLKANVRSCSHYYKVRKQPYTIPGFVMNEYFFELGISLNIKLSLRRTFALHKKTQQTENQLPLK